MGAALKSFGSLLCIAISLVYLVFVINPIQLLSAFIYPLSPNLVRKINRWCARSIWGIWVVVAEGQKKSQVRFTGHEPVWQENAFVMPNHQSSVDIIVLLSLAWRCGRLGDMKWFVKDIVKYVPGIGWGMKFIDCVFVKRNWAKDSQQIDQLFKKYKEAEIPLFLVSFLEGTRVTPKKLASSQSYAEKNDLFVPQHTLVPRTKGFVATMKGLSEHLDAIYDVTLGYPPDSEPSLFKCAAGQIAQYHVHLERFAVSELPKDEAGLNEWVMQRFEEKDALMAHFREHGYFPGPSNTVSIPSLDWFSAENSRKRPEYFIYS